MLLETAQRYCFDCRTEREHRRKVAFNEEGWQVVVDYCVRCAASQSRGALVHYAWEPGTTACLLPLGRSVYAASEHLDRVECPECLEELVHTHARAPVPDWRPESALAEDFYAV